MSSQKTDFRMVLVEIAEPGAYWPGDHIIAIGPDEDSLYCLDSNIRYSPYDDIPYPFELLYVRQLKGSVLAHNCDICDVNLPERFAYANAQ